MSRPLADAAGSQAVLGGSRLSNSNKSSSNTTNNNNSTNSKI